MSVIDKSRLIAWLDAQERCYAAELDKCRPTSNHYKSCQAKNEAFQAVILRINMGDFDDSQLAALKGRIAELEEELGGWVKSFDDVNARCIALSERYES